MSPSQKRVCVILSGCGFKDGSEIHESVSALIALSKAGAHVECFAPDISFDVVDHLTGQPTGEKRNVLHEAARIARGQIQDVKQADAASFDALVLPGGFGAAKNLCTFALEGPDCTVNEDVAAVLKAFHTQGKPIGAICIAPALVARVLGNEGITLTIGDDEGTASAINATGAQHQNCEVTGTVVDQTHKVASTPAYMYAAKVADVYQGIEKMVSDVLAMA